MSAYDENQERSEIALKQRHADLKTRLETVVRPSLVVTADEAGLWPYARLPLRLQLRIHTHTWRQRIRRFQKHLAGWWSVRRAIRATVLLAAGALLLYELREWHDDRLTRNWQLVATPAPGNSGKVAALQYLNSKFFCIPFGLELPLIGQCWKEQQNLSGIDLSKQTHRGRVDLIRVKLPKARLPRANLSEALLDNADLKGAFLRNASLHAASASHADFSGADLSEANLSAANLGFANFANANLQLAELSGAALSTSDFENAKLRAIWAWSWYRPLLRNTAIKEKIAFRKPGELWHEFVARMMRDRPELGWKRTDRYFDPDLSFTPAPRKAPTG